MPDLPDVPGDLIPWCPGNHKMDLDELFKKINDRILTICETCDTFFDYVPQKLFCDECRNKKERNRNRKRRLDPEYREKQREYHRKRMLDPEYREKQRKRGRKRRLDPEFREKQRGFACEYQRKRRLDPEFREKERKRSAERYAKKKKGPN